MKRFLKIRAWVAEFWSAVTCHRFVRQADLSGRQRRAERCGEPPERPALAGVVRLTAFEGDKPPAESADKSAHSTALDGQTTKSKVFLEALLTLLRALWPLRTRWQRYRVTPRANPATFRRELRRSIRAELRASGFHLPRVSRGTTL